MTTDPSAPFTPFPADGADVAPVHDNGHAHADPVHEEVETHVDTAVADAVHGVRDRFGARGLRDLITLASYELEVAEQALTSLSPEQLAGDEGTPA